MKFFTCLLDPEGRGIPAPVQRRYESLPRSRGLPYRWEFIGPVAVLVSVGDDASLVVRDGNHVGVGTVRLDNRTDVLRWLPCNGHQRSDLALVLHTVVKYGVTYVPQLLGDFAFVVWNSATRTALAACDAFNVKRLYYAESNGLVAFASRAEGLALEERYDKQFLAERVAGCTPSPGLSIYDGVMSLPAGSMAVLERGFLTTRPYWSPNDFEPEPARRTSDRETAERLRELLTDAVRLRLSTGGGTWAQLSGGLDSSSVVSVAEWLVERGLAAQGLAGTVTYVDRQGTDADEREYSDAVASRWRLRNVTIVDPPLWHDDRYAPPRTDQPRYDFMFYPRERRLCEIVGGAGGRVLLTGQGSDELLRGNMFFFADWLARGHIRPAVREMARRAMIGRVSFWELAYRNAVVPLLPRALRLWLAPVEARLPPWIHRGIARRYALDGRAFEFLLCAGRLGHKYHDATVTNMVMIGRTMGSLLIDDALEVRHPFLYRPLVEFGLRLPPELCVRPYSRKWVLREAMRGILPEIVRTRVGKGTPVERHAWSAAMQRPFLQPLVRDSILADLGVVDAQELRSAFDAAPRQPGRRGDTHSNLQGVLAIEAWLQMRAGRWPRGAAPSRV